MDGITLRAINNFKASRSLPEWVEAHEDYYIAIFVGDDMYAVVELTEERLVLQELDGPLLMDDQLIYTPQHLDWTTLLVKIAETDPTRLMV